MEGSCKWKLLGEVMIQIVYNRPYHSLGVEKNLAQQSSFEDILLLLVGGGRSMCHSIKS